MEPIAKKFFSRFVREIKNWNIYYKKHCTKRDDTWAVAVMHTNGVQIDKVSRYVFIIQIIF
jgi:hypothetical protein